MVHRVLATFVAVTSGLSFGAVTAATAAAAPEVVITEGCTANSLQSLTLLYGFDVEYRDFPIEPTVASAVIERAGRPSETVDVVGNGFRGSDGYRRFEPNIGRATVRAFADLDGNGTRSADEPEAVGTIENPCSGARVDLRAEQARYFDYEAGVANTVEVRGGGNRLSFQDGAGTLRTSRACEGGGTAAVCSTAFPETAGSAGGGRPIRSLDVRTGDGDDTATLLLSSSIPSSVAGGRGSDALTGGPEPTTLIGGESESGDDPLDGGDTLDGQGGNDSLSGGFGDDRMIGGPGDDRLSGDAGADRLTGGPGSDELSGGTGNDTIDSRDDVADRVACGPGVDEVVADVLDQIAAGCESVDRGITSTPSPTPTSEAPAPTPTGATGTQGTPPATPPSDAPPAGGPAPAPAPATTPAPSPVRPPAGPAGTPLRIPNRAIIARRGTATVPIACPSAGGRLRVTVTLRSVRRVGGRTVTLGTRSFTCKPGTTKVSVRLGRSGRRLLKRAKTGSLSVRASVVARDAAGRTQRLQKVLRLRG